MQGKAILSPRFFFYVLGRAAAEGSGGFGRCLQIAPSSSLPGVVACVCACGRAACLRVSRAPLACVRTYVRARVPAHVPAPVARTHARLYVRTYVRALYARAQTRGREGALSIRTYVRAHLRIRTRVPPSLSASRRVCAYVCTHAIPLGPSATPSPQREGGRRLMIPTPTFSYPVRPRAHTLTGDQPGDGVPHATPWGLFVRTYARAYTFARALCVRARARPVQGEMSPSRYAHPCTCVSTSARTSPSTPRYTRARACVRKAFGLQRCPRHDRDVSDPLPGPPPRPRTGDQPRHEGPRATSAWRFAWHCVAAKVWLLQNALPLHGRSPTTVPPVREVPPRDGARWGVRGSDGAHGALLHLRLCSRRHFHGGSRGRNDRAIHVDPGEMHWSYATWRGLVGPLGKHPCEP